MTVDIRAGVNKGVERGIRGWICKGLRRVVGSWVDFFKHVRRRNIVLFFLVKTRKIIIDLSELFYSTIFGRISEISTWFKCQITLELPTTKYKTIKCKISRNQNVETKGKRNALIN